MAVTSEGNGFGGSSATSDLSSGSVSALTDDLLVAYGSVETWDVSKLVTSIVYDEGGAEEANMTEYTEFRPSHDKVPGWIFWHVVTADDLGLNVNMKIGGETKASIGIVLFRGIDTTGTPLYGLIEQDFTDNDNFSTQNPDITIASAGDMAVIASSHAQANQSFTVQGDIDTNEVDVSNNGSFRILMATANNGAANSHAMDWTQNQSKEATNILFGVSEAPTATVYPPFPRRKQTTVRM